MKNNEIREALKKANMKQWQLAELLHRLFFEILKNMWK